MWHGLRTQGVHALDHQAARAWYARALGQEPYFDEPFYVGFDVGGYELGVLPGEPAVVAYWAVDDVEAEVVRLVAMGAEVVSGAQEVGEAIRCGCG